MPDLIGVGSVARVDELPAAGADRDLLRHRRPRPAAAPASPCGAATAAPTTAGTSSCRSPAVNGSRCAARSAAGGGAAAPAPPARRPSSPTTPLDQPLVPVATLVTHRAVRHLVGPAGDVLAELADDVVTVERRRWRRCCGGASWRSSSSTATRTCWPRSTPPSVRQGCSRPPSSSKIGRVLAPDASAPIGLVDSATACCDGRGGAAGRVGSPAAGAGRDGSGGSGRRGERLESAVRVAGRQLDARPAARRGRQPRSRPSTRRGAGLGGAVRWREPRTVEAAARSCGSRSRSSRPSWCWGRWRDGWTGRWRRRRRSGQQEVAELLDSPRWLRLVASAGQTSVGRGRGPRLAQGAARPDRADQPSAGAPAAGPGRRRRPGSRRAAGRRPAGRRRGAARARPGRPGGTPAACGRRVTWRRAAELLDRLAAVLGAMDLARAAGVAAHLAGENGFTFGRVHGLLGAQAAAVAQAASRGSARRCAGRRRNAT